ncbi:uncharacterized protein LOC132607808 [Lycium barbarum]|uniref:uncharacterized protein LOC132607808 n=1 Tax=Lycium barbarum TaxID=112863 RepID=UPI00293F631E|nr:uncharacterized protein LOC132607808 [Lycium barbarum]
MTPSTSEGGEKSVEAGTGTGESSDDEGDSNKCGLSEPIDTRAPNSDASPESAHSKSRLVLLSKTLPKDALRFGVPGSTELYEDDQGQCTKNKKFRDWRKDKKGDAPEIFVVPPEGDTKALPESDFRALGDSIATDPGIPEAGSTDATAQAHDTDSNTVTVAATTDPPPPPAPAPATSAGPTTSSAPPPAEHSEVDLFTFSRACDRELAFKTLKAEK